MICRIHRAVQGFQGKRFACDHALYYRMIREISRALSLWHFKEKAAARCVAELQAVKHARQRPAAEEPPSVIHSDLGFGNILRADHGLISIDLLAEYKYKRLIQKTAAYQEMGWRYENEGRTECSQK